MIEIIKKVIPFSRDFVLNTTMRHMRRCVDLSISKTFNRLQEFAEDEQKKMEVMSTLDVLHRIRKMLEDFQTNNKHLFTGKE